MLHRVAECAALVVPVDLPRQASISGKLARNRLTATRGMCLGYEAYGKGCRYSWRGLKFGGDAAETDQRSFVVIERGGYCFADFLLAESISQPTKTDQAG